MNFKNIAVLNLLLRKRKSLNEERKNERKKQKRKIKEKREQK